MDCTAHNDANSCLTFVSSLPKASQYVVPDDDRLVRRPDRSSTALRLLQAEDHSRESDRPDIGTAATSTCLMSVAQYGDCHWNLDAHSAQDRSPRVEEAGFWQESSSEIYTRGLTEVYQVKLKPSDILFKIRNEPSKKPVTFKNHAADSAINEVTLLGLHNDQTHVSIVEFSFDIRQLLHETKGVVAKLPCFGDREVTGSVISIQEGKVRTVIKNFLPHMQVFYCKSPFIEVEVELSNDATPHEPPSSHHFDFRAYYARPPVIMRPLVMGTIPDDDRILNNQAASTLLLFPILSPYVCEICEIEKGSSLAIPHPTMEVHDISITEQNSFTISLDCKQLYPIIKGKKMKPYPTNFKVPLKDNKNKTIPIVMKILPFKSGKGCVSVCAEISSPVEQLSTDSHMTIQATAFNHTFGCLGDAVAQSNPLSGHKLDAAKVYKDALTLPQIMLELHTFYGKRVQIDVQMQLDQQ